MPKERVNTTRAVVEETLGRRPSGSPSSCVECRLSKTRCAPSLGAGDSAGRRGSCERCARYGFECKYVASGRRGPKPKSKLNGFQNDVFREASMDDGEGAAFVDEAHLERQRATWQRLRRCPAMRGSTYTFVSQGETELTSERAVNKQTSAECYPTLRQLLRRADGQACRSKADGEWPTSLPASVSLYEHRDPVELGIVSQAQCDTLIEYFEQNMLPWICCFGSVRSALQNPSWSISGRAFLLTVVLHLASQFDARHCPASSSHALSKHARALAVHAFATLQSDENTMLAFDLLSVWKAPDDNFSEVYAVYADHVAATLTRSRRTDAPCIRAQLFHYIQRSVFHLHIHEDNSDEAGRQGNTPTDLVDILTRAPAQETLPNDWFICADVESIVIQRRCKELLNSSEAKGEQSGGVLSGAHTAILAMLGADLDVWERRWRRRAKAAVSNPAVLSSQALQILGCSVNMHLSSMAFRQASQVVLSSTKGRTAVSWCDLLAQSYQTCLAAATGILRTVQDISSLALAHAPDAIVILINHAALLSVYLSAFPVAIHDLPHRHSPRIQTLLSCSPDEILTLVQGARDALQCAAGCLVRESVCTLSADHLNGLLAVCNGSDSAFDTPDVTQDTARPTDDLYGLDWLSSVLFDLDPTLFNTAAQV